MSILQTITADRAKPENNGSIQKYRLISQIFSLVVNVWIGIQFYYFIANIQSGNFGAVSRPPGVEGWLPIGSLVSLRHFVETGVINSIHPSGLVIFVFIILTAFLFKKGFCSWICPVGLISEVLGDISDKLFRRRLKLPKWLDYILRSLKYIILGFFLWQILFVMSSFAIEQFIYTDYNKVADVLMMRFFTDITPFALKVVAGLFLLSLIIRGFWCRYLCPYGALLGVFNFISPTRIVRNEDTCIDCSSCTKVCPAFIKVESVKEVYSDECSGCMACVDSCPVNNTLEIKIVKKKYDFSKFKWAAMLVLFFWGSLFLFKLFGPWQNNISDAEYQQLLPKAQQGELTHP